MRNPLRARLAHALDRRVGPLDARVAALAQDVADARGELSELRAAMARVEAALASFGPRLDDVHAGGRATGEAVADLGRRLDDEVVGMLRVLVADDNGNRRRLEALRADSGYERPYDDPRPLVSICIPTRADRADLLFERALPSALAQADARVEVVIVGDGFDASSDPRLRAFDDPRIRVGTVSHQIRAPDPARHWLVGASLPRQEARRMARGLWITDLDDDDALRPDAVRRLLERARETRAEVTSGLIVQHLPGSGSPSVIAGFPHEFVPAWSGLTEDWRGRACTAALWHRGLRFFVRTHAAATLGVPGDLFLTIRMARAGVNFAVLEEPVYDYWPGTIWDPLRAAGAV